MPGPRRSCRKWIMPSPSYVYSLVVETIIVINALDGIVPIATSGRRGKWKREGERPLT